MIKIFLFKVLKKFNEFGGFIEIKFKLLNGKL